MWLMDELLLNGFPAHENPVVPLRAPRIQVKLFLSLFEDFQLLQMSEFPLLLGTEM